MYKNILIATDGSDLADEAIQHGLSLAKELSAKTTIVTATEIWSASDIAARTESGETDAIKLYEDFQASRAKKILTEAESKANSIGVACETIHVRDRHPAEGIIETANSRNVDLIVMASHGRRGIKKVLLGSVANEVVSHSPVPVLICR